MTGWMIMCGALLSLGLFLAAVGLLRREVAEQPAREGRWGAWLRSRPRRFWIIAAAALAGGMVAYLLTQWAIALVVVPLAIWGVPQLLAAPVNREITLVQALDRWTRALASAIPTGKSIPDAIRATRRQAPPVLAEPISRLVQRLDARWRPPDALRAMADELGSPDVDACLAALGLAASRGGTGTTATLAALSESMQHRLRALREVEAERAKPRLVVQQVTGITVVVMVVALIFGGDFFAPYRTPVGQAILALLLACYAGSLLILRRKTMPRRRERILLGRGLHP